MEEKHTAGNKEFFISIVWAIALFVISQYICAAMPEYKIVGNIFSIILFCILGFLFLRAIVQHLLILLKTDV